MSCVSRPVSSAGRCAFRRARCARPASLASPPLLPAFEKLAPYVVALVELEESPSLRMIGPVLLRTGGEISGVCAADVHIGAAVGVDFRQYSDDVAMPCWVLDE